jgi:hypothetical protein
MLEIIFVSDAQADELNSFSLRPKRSWTRVDL